MLCKMFDSAIFLNVKNQSIFRKIIQAKSIFYLYFFFQIILPFHDFFQELHFFLQITFHILYIYLIEITKIDAIHISFHKSSCKYMFNKIKICYGKKKIYMYV